MLVGQQWDTLSPVISVLEDAGRLIFAGPVHEDIRWAAVETEASVVLASPDFGYTQVARMKDGQGEGLPLPPVLLCVPHDFIREKGLFPDADDFLLVPCSEDELEVRVRRLSLRHLLSSRSSLLRVGKLSLDLDNYQVAVRGRMVQLAWMEFQLLKFLMNSPGKVFTREQLLANVWGVDHFGGTRTVDVHVRRLRHKLGAQGDEFFRTVKNVGYGLVAEPQV